MTYCECYMCRNYEKNEAGECDYVSNPLRGCPLYNADKPDKSKYYTYCGRTPLKLKIDSMEKACRFGYCDCFFGLDGKEPWPIEYCYECDELKEGDTK